MVTELKQITGSMSSNKLTSTRDVMYRIQLNSDVVKCVGGVECLVRKTNKGFLLSQNSYGVLSFERRPSKITTSFTLNLPKRLVDSWNDLGKYELEFDYENNCVELIKV